MSRAAGTFRWFGAYLQILGVVLLFTPNLLLWAFGLVEAREVWIRVLGVVVACLGVYYWAAAASEAVAVFRASVYVRAAVLVGFSGLVAVGLAEPVLVLFGAVDIAGGLWTAWALRQDGRAAAALGG